MKSTTKYALVYLTVLTVLIMLAINLAQAQEQNDVIGAETLTNAELNESEPEASYQLEQAELDQMLAPIALYPDTVLSHILVASTYPLEVIQAERWREKNQSLSEEEVMAAIEQKDWDPSVKALVPFHQLLQQITEDLNWLQDVGDAFLINEEQVLSSIQGLRQRAYAQGSLENSEYIEVVEEDNDIVIQPAKTEIVYVPYYDTRIVYGSWWWHDYPPIYWHRPAHYYWHAGLYWSPRVYIRHNIFWGAFNWRSRYTVVHHYYPNRNYRRDDGIRRVRSSEYQRWQHNPNHRRGVRYNAHTPTVVYRQQERNSNIRVRSSEGKSQIIDKSRPVQARQKVQVVKSSNKALQTQQRLQTQTDKRNTNVNKNIKSNQRQTIDRNKTEQQSVRKVPAQSRNSIIQRSQDNGQQTAPSRVNTQRSDNSAARQKVDKNQRTQSSVNRSSQQQYSNRQSQSTQRSSKSYSPNRGSSSRTVHRPQQRQSSKGEGRQR